MHFVFWIVVLFLLWILAHFVRRDLPFLTRGWQRAEGIVIGHERSVDDGSEYFADKVRFAADDGRVHEFTDTFATGSIRNPEGKPVPVIYPVGLPDLAQLPHPWVRIFLYGGLLAGIAVLVGLATGYLRSY